MNFEQSDYRSRSSRLRRSRPQQQNDGNDSKSSTPNSKRSSANLQLSKQSKKSATSSNTTTALSNGVLNESFKSTSSQAQDGLQPDFKFTLSSDNDVEYLTCDMPNSRCSKKFRSQIALEYHKSAMHPSV
ncbi:hypothetical protein GJ496_011727 [Pomphorhynchus laevis]|nr:hypothetical protein GJ496_011727 [Pomphorhynchus laevis]